MGIKITINQPKVLGRFVSIKCSNCGSETRFGILTGIRIMKRIEKFMESSKNDDKNVDEVLKLRGFKALLKLKERFGEAQEMVDALLAFRCNNCKESFEICAVVDAELDEGFKKKKEKPKNWYLSGAFE